MCLRISLVLLDVFSLTVMHGLTVVSRSTSLEVMGLLLSTFTRGATYSQTETSDDNQSETKEIPILLGVYYIIGKRHEKVTDTRS